MRLHLEAARPTYIRAGNGFGHPGEAPEMSPSIRRVFPILSGALGAFAPVSYSIGCASDEPSSSCLRLGLREPAQPRVVDTRPRDIPTRGHAL